jgi:hypothetical protein
VWLKLEEGATVGLGEVRDIGRSEKCGKSNFMLQFL